MRPKFTFISGFSKRKAALKKSKGTNRPKNYYFRYFRKLF